MPKSFAAASVTAVEILLVTGLLPDDSIETRGTPVRPFSRTAAACREKSLGIVTTASYFPLFRPSRAVSGLTTSQAMRRAWEDFDAASFVRLAIIWRPAGRVLPELSLAGSSRLTTALGRIVAVDGRGRARQGEEADNRREDEDEAEEQGACFFHGFLLIGSQRRRG